MISKLNNVSFNGELKCNFKHYYEKDPKLNKPANIDELVKTAQPVFEDDKKELKTVLNKIKHLVKTELPKNDILEISARNFDGNKWTELGVTYTQRDDKKNVIKESNFGNGYIDDLINNNIRIKSIIPKIYTFFASCYGIPESTDQKEFKARLSEGSQKKAKTEYETPGIL